MDTKTAKILTKANFAYLISLSAPHADAEAFRMAVDWCIWVSLDPGLLHLCTAKRCLRRLSFSTTVSNIHYIMNGN